MAARRTSSSKIDLQSVLRFIASREKVEYAPLIAWITKTFDSRERAAKDNVSVLMKGGWLEKRDNTNDRRRTRYALTEKGKSDMAGSFGRTALARGRRLYSTCLSGSARRRQAAKRLAADNPLAKAVEGEARHPFGDAQTDRLLQELVTSGGVRATKRYRTRSPLAVTLRRELLGERVPDDARPSAEAKRGYA